MKKPKQRRFLLVNNRRIQETSFAEFTELLVQHNPQRFGKIVSHQLNAASLYLHRDLEVTGVDLERLWIHLRCEYGITLCEIHLARIKQPKDISLYGLYKLLLHSERMREREYRYQPL